MASGITPGVSTGSNPLGTPTGFKAPPARGDASGFGGFLELLGVPEEPGPESSSARDGEACPCPAAPLGTGFVVPQATADGWGCPAGADVEGHAGTPSAGGACRLQPGGEVLLAAHTPAGGAGPWSGSAGATAESRMAAAAGPELEASPTLLSPRSHVPVPGDAGEVGPADPATLVGDLARPVPGPRSPHLARQGSVQDPLKPEVADESHQAAHAELDRALASARGPARPSGRGPDEHAVIEDRNTLQTIGGRSADVATLSTLGPGVRESGGGAGPDGGDASPGRGDGYGPASHLPTDRGLGLSPVRLAATAPFASWLSVGGASPQEPGGATPAPPSGGTATNPAPDLPKQIVRAVHMQWRQGIGEARLQLHPDHLGHLTVTLRVENGMVTAVLRTESRLTLERIEANQQELRAALEQSGLRLDRLVVAVDPDARGRRQSPQPDADASPRQAGASNDMTFDLDAVL